ncbi:E3 ubiquitin-protein ligase XIAP [Electrophorus electricus]|uniref:E3 ubiquitin-protein ligase XIAP n=1 Tax=Electrophorus electricus TaxID=8005 RepID=A0A4W4GB75_ELEEL|nr:E3 ubiquitin-protein ligase XIAP [Electrophorus electricus]XP_026872287.2 E3 ubiquitin-protein ligase XIAP [Electrophorus electricus]XP_026872298.2 E3 ubiquitin-protein ligase XIAP [Electrophorus electricus]
MAGSNVIDEIEDDCGGHDWSAMSARLNSFWAFPQVQEVSAERLARAGFYFTGEADRVRCFSCRQTVENWHQGDMPVQRHFEVSPTCKFLSCTHRSSLFASSSAQTTESIYDEEAEAMQFRLRTGEVVDQSVYPIVPHMKSEDARLRTFSSWPTQSPVQPSNLAQAGFYVPETSEEVDRVQCFCCGGMLSSWEEGDDPWAEHAKYYHNCFFILGHDVGNIPSEQSQQQSSAPRGSMESFEERLNSFRNTLHPVDHEKLARAGFYSKGERDRVSCFRCGGSLKNWQPNEDPWEEHAKHYPGCSFLLSEKGQEFVNSVQLRSPRGHCSNGPSHHERASNIMQLEIAQKAVEMGFEPIKVEATILERIQQTRKEYTTVADLIQDLTSSLSDSDSDVCQEVQTEDPLKKLEKLQREKLCKVCMDNDISVVFIPCGHLVTCKKCSDSLSKCPICCAVITQKIKTYSS